CRLADLGVRAVLVAGSTGEASALEAGERAGLVRAVRKAVPSEIPVLAGTGASSGRHAAFLTSMVVDAGADAILALAPPQSADPRPYYERVAEAVDGTPLLAYHYPAVSEPGIAVEWLPDLPVVGLKDSSGNLTRLYEELDTFDGWIYTGSADLVLVAGALNCTGAILAVANLLPEDAVAALGGDAEAQRRLAAVTRQISSPWPGAMKTAIAERFGTSTTSRMG
ncbi:MAG: dihydrodipicolinate synthase family protein, partial [Acidimicrobiales bacterium]